jgi:hypothetical protein
MIRSPKRACYRDRAGLCEDDAMNRLRTAAAAAMLVAADAIAAPSQPVVAQGLDCRADDATWRLEATRTTALFTASAPKKREIVFRGSLQPLSAPFAGAVWRGDTTHLPRETLVLVAREETCKTSDTQLTHRAVLSIRGGEAATACCAVRAGYDARSSPVANLAAKDDWSRGIVDLLPAINACVTRDAARVKAVAQASASAGTAHVRMVENNGSVVECTIEASGRGTPAIAPASGANAANPLFYPAREPPPIVGCGKLERVNTPRGALAGYLHYDPC